jgi:RNA polymerase sigma-70 factor (ECF subfamily)
MEVQATTSAIWSHLSDDLRRFVRRRVIDDHVADDLLQETFVRIHQNSASLEDKERLAAWVYRIARNVVIDHHRKSADGATTNGTIDPPDEPDDRWAHTRGRAAEWMDELIQQLPQTYRDAVRLAEIEGLSQQDVANRLGLTLSATKSRVQRGRTQLKKILNECCRFEFDRRGNLKGCEPLPDRTVCRGCDETAL